MLSCEIKILRNVDGRMMNAKSRLAKKLTENYRNGKKTPKVGDKIDGEEIKDKSSDDHFIYLII